MVYLDIIGGPVEYTAEYIHMQESVIEPMMFLIIAVVISILIIISIFRKK